MEKKTKVPSVIFIINGETKQQTNNSYLNRPVLEMKYLIWTSLLIMWKW